jgi:outer membrane protein, heavy metal efflux system
VATPYWGSPSSLAPAQGASPNVQPSGAIAVSPPATQVYQNRVGPQAYLPAPVFPAIAQRSPLGGQSRGANVRPDWHLVLASANDSFLQSSPSQPTELPPAAARPAETVSPPHPRRLEVPPELPGANAPQILLPPLDREHAQQRAWAVDRLFPPLPPLGTEYQATAIPQGRPLSLSDLEQMARQYSPQIRQAEADVRSAEGNAIQAGLYPNPTVGFEDDDIGQALTAGQPGGFVDQTIKTGGKLQLAKAAAQLDVANAQVALRKAQSDLASKVRGAYFATLVAEENVRISHALARFSDEAYNVQVDMVKGGQAAAYEPLQLRVLAYQARASLVQARNRYVSAWKQLAAAMGLPGMPPAPLAGSVDMPVPWVQYDVALAHILATNSDVLTAENTLHQSQINLRLAQVNRIPDLDARVLVQKDYTTAPFGTILAVSVGGPLPLWDHNQGNIMAADAAVMKATEGPHFARDDLTSRLADAYERYQDNIKVIDLYRQWMLPDQVQAYRGAYQRHQTEPDVVAFADVVTAQQTLATTITAYVTQLGTLWQAVVDVGSLLETDDLLHMGEPQNLPPVPNLAALCPLPCCHWSQPAAAAGWLGGDPQWPALAPGEQATK